MTIFRMHRGDTSPEFSKSLRGELGQPVDISGFTEVDFHMRDDDYNIIVDDDTTGNVSVETPSSGDVLYEWNSEDTETLGSYKAEFVVTFSDGATQSFPRHGMYDIEIEEDIND